MSKIDKNQINYITDSKGKISHVVISIEAYDEFMEKLNEVIALSVKKKKLLSIDKKCIKKHDVLRKDKDS